MLAATVVLEAAVTDWAELGMVFLARSLLPN
jgi:hypothetical protein